MFSTLTTTPVTTKEMYIANRFTQTIAIYMVHAGIEMRTYFVCKFPLLVRALTVPLSRNKITINNQYRAFVCFFVILDLTFPCRTTRDLQRIAFSIV